jgi:hypothetical protein
LAALLPIDVCGPVNVADPAGFFRRARHRPDGQGTYDSNSNRSGNDPHIAAVEMAAFQTV